MRIIKNLLVFLLIGSGTLISGAAQDKVPSASASRSIVVSPDEEYRIGRKDVVEVYILRLPELSREYQVRSDGTIELPFLGKVEAQKKTSAELAAVIADLLRDGYLVNPQVSVIVKQISRQFFIQGAVRSPGAYNIDGRPSLLELITIAGGLNPTYGGTAYIMHAVHVDGEPGPERQTEYQLRKANINALLRGDFSENVAIEP